MIGINRQRNCNVRAFSGSVPEAKEAATERVNIIREIAQTIDLKYNFTAFNPICFVIIVIFQCAKLTNYKNNSPITPNSLLFSIFTLYND
jgi:hypothetical protein